MRIQNSNLAQRDDLASKFIKASNVNSFLNELNLADRDNKKSQTTNANSSDKIKVRGEFCVTKFFTFTRSDGSFYKQSFEYKMNFDGYFGEDFNVNFGLPQGFRIHEHSLENMYKKLGEAGNLKGLLSNAWNIMNTALGNVLDEQNLFSNDELSKLPYAGLFDGLNSLQNFTDKQELDSYLFSASYSKFSRQIYTFDFMNSDFSKNYVKAHKISVEGLLVDFIFKNFNTLNSEKIKV